MQKIKITVSDITAKYEEYLQIIKIALEKRSYKSI